MKIIIAHPLAARETGAALDAVTDVDPETGTRLLNDGLARLPDSLDTQTVADLSAYAEAEGISLAGAKTKAEIIAAIEARSTNAPHGADTEGA